MVEIAIRNAFSRIDCTPEIHQSIRKLLSFEIPGSGFAQRANPQWCWDGRTYLLKKNGTFPTGLLLRVENYLTENKIEFRTRDQRDVPRSNEKRFSINPSWEPRDYQLRAVSATQENHRGVINLGTGGGKTFLAALIMRSRGLDTLYVTPDTGLREQALDDFTDYFKNPGSLLSKDVASDYPIVVSNIQSLAKKKPEFFHRFGMLITDEFHHSSAASYQKLNHLVENAYYRYGQTGTFLRTDGTEMTMHGVLSEVIFTKTTSELIEEDWLVRPHITIYRYQLNNWSRLSYRAAYDKIISDVAFNTLVSRIAQKKIDEGKQTLILIRRKDHGELLNKMIEGSHYICGDDPIEHRKTVKRNFIQKKIRCLIATGVLGEGQNITSIDVLVNARLEKTEIQTTQGIGRALRKEFGKTMAEVFDFLIVGQKHLSAHSVERIGSYKKEPAFKISVVRAPQ